VRNIGWPCPPLEDRFGRAGGRSLTPARPNSASPFGPISHPVGRGLRMTTPKMDPSSTIPVTGQFERAGLIDGSDFLPYPRRRRIDHNKRVSVGRRPQTMAGVAHEGAGRLRIQHSPQSEEQRGEWSAVRWHPYYWDGQKGFEGLMPLSRWSTVVPRSEDRIECGDPGDRIATPVP
jgi:hypothetical protein